MPADLQALSCFICYYRCYCLDLVLFAVAVPFVTDTNLMCSEAFETCWPFYSGEFTRVSWVNSLFFFKTNKYLYTVWLAEQNIKWWWKIFHSKESLFHPRTCALIFYFGLGTWFSGECHYRPYLLPCSQCCKVVWSAPKVHPMLVSSTSEFE